jgi:hypothetical protein
MTYEAICHKHGMKRIKKLCTAAGILMNVANGVFVRGETRPGMLLYNAALGALYGGLGGYGLGAIFYKAADSFLKKRGVLARTGDRLVKPIQAVGFALCTTFYSAIQPGLFPYPLDPRTPPWLVRQIRQHRAAERICRP